jgi:hypothetical protein
MGGYSQHFELDLQENDVHAMDDRAVEIHDIDTHAVWTRYSGLRSIVADLERRLNHIRRHKVRCMVYGTVPAYRHTEGTANKFAGFNTAAMFFPGDKVLFNGSTEGV